MEELEEISLQENPLAEKINCCPNIKINLSGVITEISEEMVKSRLVITNDMTVDEEGLASCGFIFGAASYVAQVAFNVEHTMILNSKVSFLAPAKLGDVVEFQASSKLNNAKKRDIKVDAFIRDIKVFEGIFSVLSSTKHILELNEEELRHQEKARKKAIKENESKKKSNN